MSDSKKGIGGEAGPQGPEAIDPRGRFDAEQLAREIRAIAEFNIRAIAEIGGRLAWAREKLDRGEFEAWLPTTDIPRTTAYRYMQVARQLSHSGTIRPTLGTLTPSKGYALLDLPESEISELADGKQVRGKTLDDFDALSATEVRDWARSAKARLAVGEKQLERARERADRATAFRIPADTGAFLNLIHLEGMAFEARVAAIEALIDELAEAKPKDVEELELRRNTVFALCAALAQKSEQLYSGAAQAFGENADLGPEDLKKLSALAHAYEKSRQAWAEAEAKNRRSLRKT